MNYLGQAGSFWRIVRSVSVTEVARASRKRIHLVWLGDADAEAWLQGPGPAPLQIGPSLTVASDENALEATFVPAVTTIVIDTRSQPIRNARPPKYFSVAEIGGWDRTVQSILDSDPGLWLALARRYPVFRPLVAERIIKEVSVANSQIAMINAAPGVTPALAVLLPVTSLADMLLLTKNQILMMYRLAAAYGLPLDVRTRGRDLIPLLGNAFGWRALARELVAIVPGGVGLVAKGGIAYAGTYAIGRALQRLYETGNLPPKAQTEIDYREAIAAAPKAILPST